MIGIKETMKMMFPNTIEYFILMKQKRNDSRIINKIRSLDEKDYPELLREIYKKKTGHDLNLKNPQRLTEKIQWRKLYDQTPIYSTLSDKYAVREWVKNKIGGEYLIPLIGAWEHFKDIDFSLLPEQFVLKTNNASHTNIIITDKELFLRQKWSAGKRIEYWLNTPFAYLEGLELHYKSIKPMIIAEQYMQPEKGAKGLVDYKFHCFSGKIELCQVIGDRTTEETIDFYDSNWQHLSINRPPFPNAKTKREKPATFDLMLELVSKLSKEFSYVRVDMYEINKKVYFGEMTFTPASGMMIIKPDEWDYKLGAMWDIHSEQREKHN